MESKETLSHGSTAPADELSAARLGDIAGGAFVKNITNTDQSINGSFNNNNCTSFVVSGDNSTQTIGGSVNFSEKASSEGGKTIDPSMLSPLLKFFND